MNERLFADLELPAPDLNLEVGSGTHAVQTAEIMRRFEPVLDDLAPACVIVVGDVNSTLACSLVAAKKRTPVVHVEAGLRSFDRDMPEEINRVLTDQIADLLFTTERAAADNLAREGIAPERMRFVGNVMIDSLLLVTCRARSRRPTRWPRAGARRRLPGRRRPASASSRCIARPTSTTARRCASRFRSCATSRGGCRSCGPCIRAPAPTSSGSASRRCSPSARDRAPSAAGLSRDAGASRATRRSC